MRECSKHGVRMVPASMTVGDRLFSYFRCPVKGCGKVRSNKFQKRNQFIHLGIIIRGYLFACSQCDQTWIDISLQLAKNHCEFHKILEVLLWQPKTSRRTRRTIVSLEPLGEEKSILRTIYRALTVEEDQASTIIKTTAVGKKSNRVVAPVTNRDIGEI